MKRFPAQIVVAVLILGTAVPAPASASDARVGKLLFGVESHSRTTAQLASATPPRSFTNASAPVRTGPATKASDPRSHLTTRTKASLAATSISQVTSFDGPALESGVFPPDTQGDVGPTQFVAMLNTRVRSYDKMSGAADGGIDIASDAFWAPEMTPVGPGGCNFSSDPHIRYDRLSDRWIAVMIDVPNCDGTRSNRIMIAVSDTDTIGPSTVWTFFHIGVTAGEFADYPTLGVDTNALYIGTNEFSTTNGSFVNSNAYVVRKSSILGAGPIVYTAFTHLIAGNGNGPFTPQGVDDPDPAIGVGYFIGVDVSSFGKLDLFRVSDPGGTPTMLRLLQLDVGSTSFPASVPHLGNTGGSNGRLDAVDDRLFAASMTSDGHIWTAHNIQVNAFGVTVGSGGRDGARWYEIDPGSGVTPSLVQAGTVFDPTTTNPRSYWIPTVAVSGQGNMVIAGSTAGAAAHVDAWYASRSSSDPLGSVGAPTLYTSSSSAYNPAGDNGSVYGARRWGDYSLTRVDPQDNQTIWTIQEYVSADDTWGVRIARLQAPGPATPTSTSSPVPLGRASVHVQLSGMSDGDTGWYDPGAGFAQRLQVDVGCGVTVNGVGFVSPTHLDLDLNTTTASGATCLVTTINPDGQMSSASVLRIARHQPDGKIKPSIKTPFVGNNVYNLTGELQTARAWRRPLSTRSFYVKEQNDGNVNDSFLLRGPGNKKGFTVHYYFRNADVTSKVVDGTFRTAILAPGSAQTLRLSISVRPGTSIGTVRSWLVTSTSIHDPAKRDVVRAIVRVVS